MTRRSAGGKEATVDKAHRIKRIVAEFLGQEDVGVSVSESEVIGKHPELLPELRRELQKVKTLRAAAQKAASQPSSSASGSGGPVSLRGEQELLEEKLTGYRIIKRLDYGGQGAVYQAVQKATNRHVAIKVLLDGPLASERQLSRFKREVISISRLCHPGIITLHDSGIVHGRPYFVMEFIDGLPIDDHILYHLLSVKNCVRLFIKVCRAVASAHQRGIIHRDLKPANILVDMSGEPKVLDFGLAKVLDDEVEFGHKFTVTSPGRVLGTLPFLCPEQVEGDEGEVDVRSDIYSLGVVLYKLLTGTFPYPVDVGTTKVYQNIVNKDPLSLRRAAAASDAAGSRCTNGEINDDLDRIVLKALAKAKDRRYQSALEFANDLDRYLADEAVEAKADGGFYVFKKALQRYRFQAASIGAVLIVVLLASALVTKQWLTARAERQEARAQREVARQVADIAQMSLDDLVGEVIETVGSLAGASAAQDKLLEIVQEGYQQLIPLVESDAGMRGVQSRIYERMGDMAGKQGRHGEAAKNYSAFLHAHQLLASGDNGSPDHDIAVLRVLRKLSDVAEDRTSAFTEAIAFGKVLVSRYPNEMEALYELCATRVAFARHLYRAGRYGQTVEAVESAVSMANRILDQRPGSQRWTKLLAEAYRWDGGGRIKLGDGSRGMNSLEESLRLHDWLVNRLPASVHLRYGLLESNMRLGSAYRDCGRLTEAQSLYQKALLEGQYLSKTDPNVAAWKRALLLTYDRLITLLRRLGAHEKAESYARAALKVSEALIATEPDNMEWRRLQAFSFLNRGKALYTGMRWEEACDDFVMALGIRLQIASSTQSSPAIRGEVADSHDWVGKCKARLGLRDEALKHHLASYELRKQLLEESPDVVKNAISCALSQIQLAFWHLEEKTEEDDRAAEALLLKAEALFKSLNAVGKLTALQHKYEAWMQSIDTNKRVVRERDAQRADSLDSSH